MAGCALAAGPTSAPVEKAAELEVRLFGPMEVRLDRQPLPRPRSRRALWLLALLALRGGRAVERDWLASSLWPDSRDVDARRSLRQSLHDLRVVLGPEARRLRGEGQQTLQLELTGAWVDALVFDAAVARGYPASLAEGVRLYRGSLLEGCAEEWAFQERAAREQACVGALAGLATAARERGEPDVAARYLRQAVGLDPFREELQRALMRSLADAGSPADALLAYRRYSELLYREMSAAPAVETTALFQQLREETRARPQDRIPKPGARGPTRDPGARSGRGLERLTIRDLPVPLTDLIGREDAVHEVIGWLERGRLVTLTGTGGVGKTRVALEVATQLSARFRDGVALVELATLSDGTLVPGAAAASLGVRESTDCPATETLCEVLRDCDLLLVLDNCEYLVAACAELAHTLLARCPGVRVLATSRQSLRVTGEVTWRVPSLEVPGAPALPRGTKDAVSHYLSYDAVRLFVARAQESDPGFRLSTGSAATMGQLCRRLDGIPLAIELAAARVRAMPVEKILERLDDRFGFLTGGSRSALARQQTLRAAIDWSYALLSDAERLLLARLSMFAGGFTLEAAEAVCGDADEWKRGGMEEGRSLQTDPASTPPFIPSSIQSSEILDLLTGLVDKSLVVYDRSEAQAGGERYRLLETLRDYAAERLEEAGEAVAVRERHLGFFLRLAENASTHLMGAEQGEWLERLEMEHSNLRAGLDWAASRPDGASLMVDTPSANASENCDHQPSPIGPREVELRLAAALWRFWMVRGHAAEGRARLARALAATSGATPTRARALTGAGALAWRQSDYYAARQLDEESLAMYRQLGDNKGVAGGLNNLGMIAAALGEYPAARALYEESLGLKRELGERLGIAHTLNNLGMVASAQGDYPTARSLHEESLALFRQLQSPWNVATSLNHLGILAYLQGDYHRAKGYYDESLAIKRDLGDSAGIADGINNLGVLAYSRGEHDRARSLHEESLALRRACGERSGVATSLKNLALVAHACADFNLARSLYVESAEIRRETGDRSSSASLLEAMAGLALDVHDACREAESSPVGADSTHALSANDATKVAWRSARLLGAAAALREALKSPRPPEEQEPYERALARARQRLADSLFGVAWEEGRGMDPDEAITRGLEDVGAVLTVHRERTGGAVDAGPAPGACHLSG